MQVEWQITKLILVDDPVTGFVIRTHYRIAASDDYDNYSDVNGRIDLQYSPGNPVIPYEDLTQDQIVAWVKDTLGPEKEQELLSFLQEDLTRKQENSKYYTKTLPWVQPIEPPAVVDPLPVESPPAEPAP